MVVLNCFGKGLPHRKFADGLGRPLSARPYLGDRVPVLPRAWSKAKSGRRKNPCSFDRRSVRAKAIRRAQQETSSVVVGSVMCTGAAVAKRTLWSSTPVGASLLLALRQLLGGSGGGGQR